MAALQRVLGAVRQGVLANVRLQANYGMTLSETAAPVSLQFLRKFADASYLNKTEVTDRVLNVVKNFDKVDSAKVSATAGFQKDLGLDSLDVVELVMALEEEFAIEIPDSEADKILTTAEAINYISSNPMAK